MLALPLLPLAPLCSANWLLLRPPKLPDVSLSKRLTCAFALRYTPFGALAAAFWLRDLQI